MRRPALSVAAGLVAAGLVAAPALGAEGAASHFLPGAGGDMLLAIAPQPGMTVANTVWRQSGAVGWAVVGGRPGFSASARSAATSPVCSGRCSMNSRTARSRNAGEYGFLPIFLSMAGEPRRV